MRENMDLTLVILAAGIGSRYGGLKQVDSVGPSGETILDYSIFDAIEAGFKKIVFVIRHEIEDVFKKSIGRKYEKLINIKYAFQELDALPEGFKVSKDRIKPWGTAHAVLSIKDIVDSPFVLINADDFYGKSSYKVIAEYLTSPDLKDNQYCMVGFVLGNTLSDFGSVSRGICKCDSNNNLANIIEYISIERKNGKIICNEGKRKLDLTANELVSMNFWGFTPFLFAPLENLFIEFLKDNINNSKSEFYIPYAVDKLIKSGNVSVKVLRTEDCWFGVTYPEDKLLVKDKISKLVNRKLYPEKLFND